MSGVPGVEKKEEDKDKAGAPPAGNVKSDPLAGVVTLSRDSASEIWKTWHGAHGNDDQMAVFKEKLLSSNPANSTSDDSPMGQLRTMLGLPPAAPKVSPVGAPKIKQPEVVMNRVQFCNHMNKIYFKCDQLEYLKLRLPSPVVVTIVLASVAGLQLPDAFSGLSGFMDVIKGFMVVLLPFYLIFYAIYKVYSFMQDQKYKMELKALMCTLPTEVSEPPLGYSSEPSLDVYIRKLRGKEEMELLEQGIDIESSIPEVSVQIDAPDMPEKPDLPTPIDSKHLDAAKNASDGALAKKEGFSTAAASSAATAASSAAADASSKAADKVESAAANQAENKDTSNEAGN